MKVKHFISLIILIQFSVIIQAQIIPGLVTSDVRCGAERTELYLQLISGKRIGVVANPSSRIHNVHLVDSLTRCGVRVMKIFAPEHGFRGEGEAGAVIQGGVDPVTRIPVISLYGKHKKPTPDDLADLDILVFDIQDVGARFYTYISTLHLVMEACAEGGKPLVVLDRPNPNGFYVDGPVLDTAFHSFVGMHPVPVVYGMTIGEYARMVNGEGWLKGGVSCSLTVIPCEGYTHQTAYVLPVKPSPNLPDQVSIYLYPSLCFFEGTIISVGRGTEFPFKVYGSPKMKGSFHFTPQSKPGNSQHPMYENLVCYGRDLNGNGVTELSHRPGIMLEWLIDAYEKSGKPSDFFTGYFDTLAGTDRLRRQIQQGMTADEIRATWKDGLDRFAAIRCKYLIYK